MTPQGFTAIKDGQKPRAVESPSSRVGKPRWITAPLATGAGFSAVKDIVREHRLATVCEEAKCPEHRGVLERGHGHHHADGRGVHACLPLLFRGHG